MTINMPMRVILLIVAAVIVVSIVLETIIPVIVLICMPLVAMVVASITAVFLTKKEGDKIIIIGLPPFDVYTQAGMSDEIDRKSLN